MYNLTMYNVLFIFQFLNLSISQSLNFSISQFLNFLIFIVFDGVLWRPSLHWIIT